MLLGVLLLSFAIDGRAHECGPQVTVGRPVMNPEKAIPVPEYITVTPYRAVVVEGKPLMNPPDVKLHKKEIQNERANIENELY
jgi:hypothetical protein